jgi:hypothetical protein
MNKILKTVKVRGYNKTHTFDVVVTSMAGYTFFQLNKNGNKVLSCTPEEYQKFITLFRQEEI